MSTLKISTDQNLASSPLFPRHILCGLVKLIKVFDIKFNDAALFTFWAEKAKIEDGIKHLNLKRQ